MCEEICSLLLSRPSRGAWIEIIKDVQEFVKSRESRPSRGAWIEMPALPSMWSSSAVAPLAGRVD